MSKITHKIEIRSSDDNESAEVFAWFEDTEEGVNDALNSIAELRVLIARYATDRGWPEW